MQPSIPDLTPDTVRDLVRDDALFRRGVTLAQQGAVAGAARRGRLLLAHVQGSEPLPYSVTLEPPLKPRGKRWAASCTCPYYEIYDSLCKHAIAVLYEWATHPDRFIAEPTLDEHVAGLERDQWLPLIRNTRAAHPAIESLLAVPPERSRPLRRAINLDPYAEQLRVALLPKYEISRQIRLARSVLESAAGYVRIGDGANAVRIATLVAETLLPQSDTGWLLFQQETLLLLEIAALDATWSDEHHSDWTAQIFRWWEYTADTPALADQFLELILHTYRPATEKQVVGWLRTQLRRPIHTNQKAQRHWRERIRLFLLAYYEAHHNTAALLDLCWEEGDDRRAAITLARQGDTRETVRLARQGLGDATTHRLVAELLAGQGFTEAATTVAEAGRGYHDRGRAALLTWLADAAATQGDGDAALQDALAAWAIEPNAERYRLIRGMDGSAEQRRRLLADIPAKRGDLRVEVLMADEAWLEAIAHLQGSGVRRAELTELLARALSDSDPARSIALLFDLAALHAEISQRSGYQQAVRAILAAQSVAERHALTDEFVAALDDFKASHRRKRLLMEMVAEL